MTLDDIIFKCLFCNGWRCSRCNNSGWVTEDIHNQQLNEIEKAKIVCLICKDNKDYCSFCKGTGIVGEEGQKKQRKILEDRRKYYQSLDKWLYEEEERVRRAAISSYWADQFNWGSFNRFFR